MVVIDKITGKFFRTKEEYEQFLKLTEKEKEKKLMKVKVIKSEDKNFEEEKIKMFEPKTLTKEEQLRLVFKHLLTAMIADFCMSVSVDEEKLIKKYTNIFLYEVRSRVKL